MSSAPTLSMPRGPLIEELPDDYDIGGDKAVGSGSKCSTAGSGAAPQSSGDGRTGGDATLRRGFFNKASKPAATHSAPARSASVPKADIAQSAPVATRQVVEEPEGSRSHLDQSQRGTSNIDEALLPSPTSIVEGLRRRLQVAADSVAAARHDEATQSARALNETIASLRTHVGNWPTAHARNGREKATKEIEEAVAEMRSASNDSRRLRSGEERRAWVELRRTAEEVVERVRKVADAAAPQESTEDRAATVVAAFHTLPLTAKLRVLADERVAIVLLGASFVAGALLVFVILSEFFIAWNCGMRCGQ